jgi:hypothetical protein
VAKQYRPKSGKDGLSIDINIDRDKSLHLAASDFPYTPKDDAEVDALANHPLVTDRPEPKSQRASASDA